LETLEEIPRFSPVAILNHLVQRGFIAITAEAYHLTYLQSELDRLEWTRWRNAGEALTADHPQWSGVGKLTADTRLLVDDLMNDERVDHSKIGIAGHSLGGKMAFYNGCLDDRIRVILASDFGIGWEQSNWQESWYWGEKLEQLKHEGLEHSSLLGCAGGKPFCLLAGKYDDDHSWEIMQKAPGYTQSQLQIVNHATGHRPPWDALCQGYDFMDRYLK
jgi:hypothetical protein